MESMSGRTIFSLFVGGLVVLSLALAGAQAAQARFMKEDAETAAQFKKRCAQQQGKVVHYDGLDMTLCEHTTQDIKCEQQHGKGWLFEDGHCLAPEQPQ